MEVFQVEELSAPLKFKTAVCLGVFDGVHLGHLKLINTAIDKAASSGTKALAHTYNPEPFCVLHPEQCLNELTNLNERLSLFEKAGLKYAAVSRFTSEMQHESGEHFFHGVLLDKLNAGEIVVGFNHRFGYKGDTDVQKLAALCAKNGVGLTVIEPVKTQNGQLISSTAIRTAILKRDYDLAQEMLGRTLEEELIKRLHRAT